MKTWSSETYRASTTIPSLLEICVETLLVHPTYLTEEGLSHPAISPFQQVLASGGFTSLRNHRQSSQAVIASSFSGPSSSSSSSHEEEQHDSLPASKKTQIEKGEVVVSR